MSAASYEMIEILDFRSLDRSEDVIFELVWVIKRSILSFPVYIAKKNVESVIDPAVLHWTRRLSLSEERSVDVIYVNTQRNPI